MARRDFLRNAAMLAGAGVTAPLWAAMKYDKNAVLRYFREQASEMDACVKAGIEANRKGDGRIASSITGVPARDGMPARRPRNITLRNISLSVPGGGTEKDAAAQVPEKDSSYPEAFMFNQMALPAYGFYVRHADRVKFENVTVTPRSPDARKPFVFDDCADCTVN